MKKIILASGSPRRKELLKQLGLEFEIMLPLAEEKSEESDPALYVQELALAKAMEVCHQIERDGMVMSSLDPAFQDLSNLVVLGSDTVVTFEGKILGKPHSEDAALKMLTMLQGQTHRVYTGVAFAFPRQGISKWDAEKDPTLVNAPTLYETFEAHTDVTMYEMSQSELLNYIASGEPMDKAGAYGIQGKGGFLVKEIQGDYNTVVGLPVSEVYHRLKAL